MLKACRPGRRASVGTALLPIKFSKGPPTPKTLAIKLLANEAVFVFDNPKRNVSQPCLDTHLSMAGSWTQSIEANGLVVSGSVTMNLGFHAEGEIDLVGAKIDGNLDFLDATILNSGDWAIVADNIKATNVLLSAHWSHNAKGFRAEGTVSFPGATISGDFGGEGSGVIHRDAQQ